MSTCAARKCNSKARPGQPMCAIHWFQIEPRLRTQIRNGTVPLTIAVLMIESLEAAEKRQEKIDEAGGL